MQCEFCDHLAESAANATMAAVSARERLRLLAITPDVTRQKECKRAEDRARELRRELIAHKQSH